jgi:hypothetical protein
MLKLTPIAGNKYTMQFTGADLKKWYAEKGWFAIYICHVLESVVTETIQQELAVNSRELVTAIMAVVPERFKQQTVSPVITMMLLKKYHSRGEHSPFRTRLNLLNCIPDEHEFTLTLK